MLYMGKIERCFRTRLDEHSVVDISAQFLHNRAFPEESTIFTECADFYASMNIRYGFICEINAEGTKRISNILI